MKIFNITTAIFLLTLCVCSAAQTNELLNYFRSRLRDPPRVTSTDSKTPLLGAISPSAVRFTNSLTDRIINGFRNFAGRPRTSSTSLQSTRPRGNNIISSIKLPYSSFLADLLSSAVGDWRSSLSTDRFSSRRQPPFGKGRYNSRSWLNRGRGRGRWQRVRSSSLSYGYYIRRAIYAWLRACKKLKYKTQNPRMSTTSFPTARKTELDFKVSTPIAAESTTYLPTTEAPAAQEVTTRIATTQGGPTIVTTQAAITDPTTTQSIVISTLAPQDTITMGSSKDPNEDDDDNDVINASSASAGTTVTTMASPAGSKATTLSSAQSTTVADNAETTLSVVTVSSDSSTSASTPVETTPSLPDATTTTILPDIPDITTAAPASSADLSITESSSLASTTSSATNEASSSVSSSESSPTPATSVASTSFSETTAAASSTVPAKAPVTATSSPPAVSTSSSNDPNEDSDDSISSAPTATSSPGAAALAETSSSSPDQATPVFKTITVIDGISETVTGGFNPDSLNVGGDILADNAVDNLILP